MIAHIEGRLVQKNPTDVVIDCNGVGYFLNISLHTFSQLPTSEKKCEVVHTIAGKEDSHTLYGFSTMEEREVFNANLLISVSGLALALGMLSPNARTSEDAIISEDVVTIQAVKDRIQNGTACGFRSKR